VTKPRSFGWYQGCGRVALGRVIRARGAWFELARRRTIRAVVRALRRLPASSALVALAVLAASAPASADEEEASVPAPGPSPERVAVLLLPAGEAVDPAMADVLSELLIAAVVARGEPRRIVGREELQAQLGRDDGEMALCIESAACLGRIGVQLGVGEVIAGTIARRAESTGPPVWAFHLSRVDVRTGERPGHVFREVPGALDQLLRALEESVPELYVRLVAPGRLVVRATVEGAEVELDGVLVGRAGGAPLRRETVAPGAHVLRVRAPGHRSFERTLEVEEGATLMIDAVLERAGSWVPSPLVYAGGAMALASIVAGVALGVSSQGEPDASLTMRETLQGFYPAREAEALAANVLFGVAAAGALCAALGVALSGEEDPGVSVAAAPLGDGMVLGLGGRF
jgi:hypothetical protein